jgi:hypothetical protein
MLSCGRALIEVDYFIAMLGCARLPAPRIALADDSEARAGRERKQ